LLRKIFARLVYFTRGLLSTQLFSRDGFCPLCHFHGRTFVRCHIHGRVFIRSVILTGGLLSALSYLDVRAFVRFVNFTALCHFHGKAFVRLVIFGRQGFCPPCHIWTGGLFSGRALSVSPKVNTCSGDGRPYINTLILQGREMLLHVN
jgi:hypothetical protein